MRLNPPHEKCRRNEQKGADRECYANCQKFHSAIARLAVFYQGEQAGSHAKYDQQQQDGDDSFNHGTTRVRIEERLILTEMSRNLP